MENWIILTKLIVLAYCASKYVEERWVTSAPAILFMLIYVSVNVTYHLIENQKLKKVLPFILAVLISVSSLYISGLFLFLLPGTLYEIAKAMRVSWWVSLAVAFFSLFSLKIAYRFEYLLLVALTFLIYSLADQSYGRIQNLTRENDVMREDVHVLAGKLNRDIDYERQIKYSSQLEERNKLAQEIHDKVGHTISGSLIQLEAAKLMMDRDKAKSLEILQGTINILREGMENIRATLRNIKPAAEQLGINRIRLILDEFSVNQPIKTRLVHTGNLEKITHAEWRVITDNIVEALTNTLKYAGATTLSVHIEVLNTLIKVEVKDDGIGTFSFKKGLGIRGMEERSGTLGGKIIVDGSKGFSVITLLPLEGEK